MEETLKAHLVQTFMAKVAKMRFQMRLPAFPTTSWNLQPHLKTLQLWEQHHIPMEVIPVNACVYCVKCLSHVKVKLSLVQLVLFASHLLCVVPCGVISFSLQLHFYYWNAFMRSPWALSFPERKDLSPSIFPSSLELNAFLITKCLKTTLETMRWKSSFELWS